MLGILVAIGFIIAGSIPVVIVAGDSGLDATIGLQIVLEASLIGAALVFATRVADGLPDAWGRLGLRRPTTRWIRMTAVAMGIYFAFAFLLAAVATDPEQVDLADELGFDESLAGAISAGLLIVIAAPLAEEIFFRGFLFGGLRERMPMWAAALISGAVFGAIHLNTGNAVVGLQLAVLGVILAVLYERAGSLWAPIALHGFNNALAFTLLVST